MLRLIPALVLLACSGGDDGPSDSGDPPLECDVSWALFVEPTLRNWCVPCHSVNVPEEDRRGAPLGVDFDTWEQSNAWGARIAARVLDLERPMPPAGGLAEWERADLSRWAECGAEGTPKPADPCDAPVVFAGDATAAGEPCAGVSGAAVTGDLVLSADPGAALDCLCRVDGAVRISGGAEVVALPRLSGIGGDLVVQAAVRTLALPALAAVGGAVSLQGPALVDVDLDRLVTVGGEVTVSGGRVPATFGPVSLGEVGALRIEGVAGLETLDLPRLEQVASDLVVAGNPDLARVIHTSDLEAVGGALRLLDNPRLTATEDFTFLTSIGGDLEIGGNAIAEYRGFYQLTAIGGSLILRDDLTPSSLDAFGSLVTIGGTLALRNLGATEVDGFDDLDEVGGIEVTDAPGLGTWRAGSARVVRGDVLVSDDPNLRAMPFLRDVTEITGALTLRDLRKVEAVGLPDLRSVGGTLTLQWLDQLRELDGLHGLTAIGGDLVIAGNRALSQAEIDALLVALGPGAVAGEVLLQNNGP